MRFEGTLKSWNNDRGFGFIAPRQGGDDIFVHITAFPRDGKPPREREVLNFEIETTQEGKKRAVRVNRPMISSKPTTTHLQRFETRNPDRLGFLATLIFVVIIGGIGWYGYGHYRAASSALRATQTPEPVPTQAPTPLSEPPPVYVTKPSPEHPPVGNFRCDGRTYCSQMTSCSEAKYFLRNCPGVKMDGNNDGIPCEQQWCTGPGAR
jgi:cold shock CspA family protein